MSVSYARASRIASSCPKDFDFQFFVYQNEGDYPMWMSPRRIINGMYDLPESVVWNALLCLVTLINLIMLCFDYEPEVDVLFNVKINYLIMGGFGFIFFLDIVGRIMNDHYDYKHGNKRFPKSHLLWYFLDVLSYSHYGLMIATSSRQIHRYVAIACFYERMHRPIGFLWSLLDYYLIGAIFFSLLKYVCFVFVMRIVYANFFAWTGYIQISNNTYPQVPSYISDDCKLFFRAYYFMTILFVSLGPDTQPATDVDRIWHTLVMISGTLVVTGITIAALACIIGIYLRPEETFRARFRLIMNEMKQTNVSHALTDKVDTFYRMYWHKQKAVSVTQLLPTYPPGLVSAITTDIYFEAQQKSRVLRDLSYNFLSEIAKCMKTINYIPGDTIVKRNTAKSEIIYISYGDVEMLTAEDDDTAILRFTRGSIINPCGASVVVASTLAHVGIRAATFCTAHVLKVADLWRVSAKCGKSNGQNFILHSSFLEHFERVRIHYESRHHPDVKYKSSIHLLKRNLMELKEATDKDNNLLLARADVFLELAGCYVMRNRKDTTLTEESDAICLRPTFPCILQPMSSLLVAWQMFISLIILIIAFVYPYYYVYADAIPPGFRFLDYVFTFLFLVDIVTYLSIGAKIEEGVPVTFTHTSMRQMQTFWFVLDVLSIAPIFEFITNGNFAGINKLLKLPEVFRVLKHFEDVWVYQANAFRFLSYCLLTILLSYLVAAFHQGMMCTQFKFCEVTDLIHAPHWSENKTEAENTEQRLIYGLYWAISIVTFTAQKTSSISGHHWVVQLIIMGVIMLSTNLHILIESTYSATIMVSEIMKVEYDNCISTVQDFLVKSNVNAVVRQRFISYLQLCWFTDKAYSINHGKTSILYDLPQHVYQDILAMQRSKYILCIPFMKFANSAEFKVIAAQARLFYTSPNEILLNTGDISNEIYVIKQGFCEVLDPISKKVVSLITVKSNFGDLECLLRIPAYYTVRAVTHVQVFSVSRRDLLKVIALPKIRDAILYAKRQKEYSSLKKHHSPFISYEALPPPLNRELFPLPRKHEPDTAFLYPFTRLGFLSILRYVFPRFTIRPDGTYLRRYEWFRAVFAFLSANILPLCNTLKLQWPEIATFTWFLDVTAYCDIIHRMLVGYFNEKGILVYHPASTAAYYIQGAFLMDLVACLPFETLDDYRMVIFIEKEGYKMPKVYQILQYNRFLQLYRVPNALGFLTDYIKREDIIFVIKTFPMFMCTLVLFTSLMILFSVDRIFGYDHGYEIRPCDYLSWITDNKSSVGYNITESAWSMVLTTFYWITYELTSTGFNIFQPHKLPLIYFLFVGMFMGQVITTYFSVRVISIRSKINSALASFQQNMKDMKTFMKKENFNLELQQEVISYYQYMWDKTGGTDYRSVLKMCDQITLRTDAILHIYGQTFAKCPILNRSDQSLLRVVGRAVHSGYFKGNMVIIDRDEVVSDMYFLDYGTVAVHGDDTEEVLTKLPRGSLFGNLDNKETALSTKRFVASSNMHLLKIKSVIFYRIIQDFPNVRKQLIKFRANNESYIIGSVQGKVMKIWKERAASSPIIVVTRKGFLNFIHKNTKLVQVYLILVSMGCVYVDIYNAGYTYNDPIILGILYTLDFLFVLKIIGNFLLPFITEESESRGVLMSSRKTYVKGELKYDILSVLPLELLSLAFNNPWNAFGLLRLNRIFRTVTVNNCLKKYSSNLSINLTLTTVSVVFIWFSFFVHCTTCMWYLLGTIEENKKPKSSWRYTDDGKEWCYNHYICSLYFILTTFTQNGTADILPRQKSEVVFVIILMIISNMLYMIYVGEFSNILQYQSFRSFRFYGRYLQLQAFLKNNRVSKNLVEMVEKYTLHLWRESRGLQTPRFLLAAPQCLRIKIMSAAYMEHLTSNPAFKDCEPAFLRHLSAHFQPFYYNDSMYVVREGEITTSMYFIHKGRVEEIDEILEDKLQEFQKHQVFGLFQGLHRDTSFTYSYKTVVDSEILTLSLDNWEYLLQHFPISKDILYPDKPDDDNSKGKTAGKKIKMVTQIFGKSDKIEGSESKSGTDKLDMEGVLKSSLMPKKPDAASTTTQSGMMPLKETGRSASQGNWPMLNRRRSSDIPYANDDAASLKVESEVKPKPKDRRKSVVDNVDRAAVEEELRRLASTPNISLAVENPDSGTPETKLTLINKKTESSSSSKSPFPMTGRQRSSDEIPYADKGTEAKSKEVPKVKPKPVDRRKSVVDNVDRAAVEEELRRLASAPNIEIAKDKVELDSKNPVAKLTAIAESEVSNKKKSSIAVLHEDIESRKKEKDKLKPEPEENQEKLLKQASLGSVSSVTTAIPDSKALDAILTETTEEPERTTITRRKSSIDKEVSDNRKDNVEAKADTDLEKTAVSKELLKQASLGTVSSDAKVKKHELGPETPEAELTPITEQPTSSRTIFAELAPLDAVPISSSPIAISPKPILSSVVTHQDQLPESVSESTPVSVLARKSASTVILLSAPESAPAFTSEPVSVLAPSKSQKDAMVTNVVTISSNTPEMTEAITHKPFVPVSGGELPLDKTEPSKDTKSKSSSLDTKEFSDDGKILLQKSRTDVYIFKEKENNEEQEINTNKNPEMSYVRLARKSTIADLSQFIIPLIHSEEDLPTAPEKKESLKEIKIEPESKESEKGQLLLQPPEERFVLSRASLGPYHSETITAPTNLDMPPSQATSKKEDKPLPVEKTSPKSVIDLSSSLESIYEDAIDSDTNPSRRMTVMQRLKSVISGKMSDDDDIFKEKGKDKLMLEQEDDATKALIKKLRQEKAAQKVADKVSSEHEPGKPTSSKAAKAETSGKLEIDKHRRSVRYVGPVVDEDTESEDDAKDDAQDDSALNKPNTTSK